MDGLFILSFARMEGAEINTTYGENSAVRRTFKAYNKTERPLLSLTWEALNQGNYSGELQQTERIQTTVLGTPCSISGARVLLERKHIFSITPWTVLLRASVAPGDEPEGSQWELNAYCGKTRESNLQLVLFSLLICWKTARQELELMIYKSRARCNERWT